MNHVGLMLLAMLCLTFLKNSTKDLPNSVDVSSFKIEGIGKLEKTTYMDMYNRVKKMARNT